MSANGDLHDVAVLLRRHFGPLRPVLWTWRPVAFGPCVRCRWPAHTLADGHPYHPFCWLNPDPPSPFSEWVRHKDGTGEWGSRPPEQEGLAGERQWCAVGRRWFDPTPERLAICDGHAAEMVARWRR